MLVTNIPPSTNSQQLTAYAIVKTCRPVERTVYLIPKFRKLSRDRSVFVRQQ